jgi:hypothetical protein
MSAAMQGFTSPSVGFEVPLEMLAACAMAGWPINATP